MTTNGANGTTHAPASNEQVKTDIITLTRFLTEEQAKHREATGDFTYGTIKLSPAPSVHPPLILPLQPPLPRPPVLFQVNRILDSTCQPCKPLWPSRIL